MTEKVTDTIEGNLMPTLTKQRREAEVVPPGRTAIEQPTAIDIGNASVKLAQGSRLSITDSCVAELLSQSELSHLSEGSAFVRYLAGARPDLVGKQWVTGNDAKLICPDTYQRVVDKPKGKASLGLQLLLGVLFPPTMGDKLVISTLYSSLPDPALLGQQLCSALLGTHLIERNGHQFEVQINALKVLEEGQGALIYALNQGLCTPSTINATIDCGSGTTISQAYTERGDVLPNTRLVQDRGVNELALMIVRDDRMKALLGKHADPSLILEAIRAETYLYGGQRFDFGEIFRDNHRIWLQSVAAPALRKLTPIQDRLNKILLIGGGSAIAGQLNQGIIATCPNAQVANVQGLLVLARRMLMSQGRTV